MNQEQELVDKILSSVEIEVEYYDPKLNANYTITGSPKDHFIVMNTILSIYGRCEYKFIGVK